MAEAIVIDATPLVLLAKADPGAIEWLDEAVARGAVLYCAGATYAEVWRGHSQSPVHGAQAIRLDKVLKTLIAVPTCEVIGRGAGDILAAASLERASGLTLDAIVVATAVV